MPLHIQSRTFWGQNQWACCNQSIIAFKEGIREGFKKRGKVWSFTKPGGGVTEGNKKSNPFFLEKYFFQ